MSSTTFPPAKPDLGSLRIDDRSHPSGSSGKRTVAILTVLVLLVAAGAAYFFWKGRTPIVEVALARTAGDPRTQALLNASGYVTPRRRATVASKITGRVTGVFFDEGVHVRDQQELATLDDSDVRRALESSKADRDAAEAAIADFEVQLKYAEVELKRADSLQAAGVQSQEALDNARMQANSLRAKIALAKSQVVSSTARIAEAQQAVDNCVIRAPFDGIIVSKDAQVGEMVSPISAGGGFTRTGIATIVDMNSNEVEVDVNESYIARVKPGQRAISTLDAYPDWQIPSSVRTVIPTADRQKATVKVRVSFDHLDPKILPDMGVKVAFLSDQPASEGTAPKAKAIIPQNVVRKEGEASVVWVVKDGKIERRAVTLGTEHGSDIEVMAGVSPGDSLVLRGPEGLHEGQAVEIKQ
jgi:RND family efflux transporter MFP subunit